jgi:hypothetical protein
VVWWMERHEHHDPASDAATATERAPMTWSFSLFWSILTSSLGVLLLLTLRALVVVMMNGCHTNISTKNNNNNNSNPSSSMTPHIVAVLQKNMEHSVATGTLWGVSVAWIVTDAVLGISLYRPNTPDADPNHFTTNQTLQYSFWYVPALVSCLALLGWHVVLAITTRMGGVEATDTSQQHPCDDLSTPLLLHDQQQPPQPQQSEMMENAAGNSSDSPTIECSGHWDGTNATHHNRPTASDSVYSTQRKLQLISLLFGILVGMFIQCSTLGATFLAQFVCFSQTIRTSSSIPHDISYVQRTVHMLEVMSVVGSFVTSCMGMVLLLFVRGLLLWIIRHCNHPNNHMLLAATTTSSSPKSDTKSIPHCHTRTDDAEQVDEEEEEEQEVHVHSTSTPIVWTFLLVHVESFFATGTVLGLNIAWMITDYVLSHPQHHETIDYQRHWRQSVYTLIVSTIWCQFILYCTGYYSKWTISSTTTTTVNSVPIVSPPSCPTKTTYMDEEVGSNHSNHTSKHTETAKE